MMKLVAGLGNPGRKYESTRHNAGFWWAERLARQTRASFRSEARFHGRLAKIEPPHGEAWLLLPETFMNHSGQSVSSLVSYFKLPLESVLIVHDELDLPAGTVRLKKGGGTGGHNGVSDVAAHLGSKDFWRLRIGIGHPGPGMRDEVLDYVLQPPRTEERDLIESAIDRSLELWALIAEAKMEAAMLKLHTKKATE